jgi:hypothetical protein
MITLPAPHMALNATDVPGPPYRMWENLSVPSPVYDKAGHLVIPGMPVEDIIFKIQMASLMGTGRPGLRAVVLNCHGYEVTMHEYFKGTTTTRGGVGLALGVGIKMKHTPLFADLNGYIGEIYVVACRPADDPFPGGRKSAFMQGQGDGMKFFSEIARNAGATVYASDATQTTGALLGIPYGKIDGYEGTVYKWGPDGKLAGSRKRWKHGSFDS